jgi:high affinity sulfate transporter 1
MKRYIPILSWLPRYRRSWLRADVVAGVTIMALLVPEGMAYAELAGVPPQAAFYAAPIGLLLYAAFGTSRQLVVAVSSGIAVMSASIIGGLAVSDSSEFIALTAALAVMAGLVAVVAGLLRLGRIARFFSPSVLLGFVMGLALLIIIKQLPKIFGLESGEGNSWERLFELVRSLPDTHAMTLFVGASTIVLMLLLERWFRRVPAALVALIYGIALVSIFGLEEQGVHVIGEIPAGLAPPQLPNVSSADLVALVPGALAITLVMFAEALGPARRFAANHGYRIRENQELVGLGMANIGAGLFQGFPIGASLSKSAAAEAAGGRTQVAGMVAAVATAIVALFLTPVFANLPEAALGAIVIVAVSRMVRVIAIRRLYRVHKKDFTLAFAAVIGVLTFDDVIAGLLVAVAISLVALVLRISKPQMSRLVRLPGTLEFRNSKDHPEGLSISGLLILRPDEGLFFANAQPLAESARESIDAAEEDIRTVLLDFSLTSDTDVPGVSMLGNLSRELDATGIELRLASVRVSVLDLMSATGVLNVVGEENIHSDVASGTLDYIRGHDLESPDFDAVVLRMSELADLAARHTSELTETQRASLTTLRRDLENLFRENS